ncbi:hypothetical protein H9Q72_012303 [Fusarium xylarioides]|uniref:Uncharacterized protein n=1 Tax=Fusarium xylarioides TaxID=221167 RepID=A0A9P7HH79_9HYPO|nr:hypothetical protein H9Q70_009903 [Fusarium xylarioides]KAG5759569.1 hypothetical protein H9Q72_012303 [Fusarium xylarioides]KAG5776307.1 hypothetical protein H9Q73_010024 [Fusarium xylarioides]
MSTRRSARIRNIDLGVTSKSAEPAPAPTAPPKRKRKASAEDEKDEPTTKGKKVPVKKVKATKTTHQKTKAKANFTAEIETQSLEIHDYNMYNTNVQSNPGLSRRLLQSVVKHTGLETLRFHYRHSGREPWDIPFASAESVNILTKNLPSLRVFEVAPQEDNLDAMARALSRAKNLTNLPCPNFKSYHEDRENAHLNLVRDLRLHG